ncbi:hypothetical protein COCC4DRAFT_33191 [Bipolaris maydis ATCC 48331]|uniref:GRF-like zinc ribbon domain-containing protein n=2 Tax=Cochliobolus heterostrophus TaxID=5016 RepID=M2TJM5_COCH5|nr:uncharacterized protein COCC4DRAFT_33191 [Bipolaris maydis ATCC 48331]EMD86689.1 hypothetical protein COCHEDRAFT_1185857 [Bipolaris maydis C5]KAJ5042655.1 hypothetical protein J3E74DRAFT_393032 [Bipolaris maydis]ENI03085.1 hypothetical protein COCC4DRAFT_33191 [Bipolaris maydis ATCC 48331]KAJ5052574.1 hypothetical protein J3E74DRAFT_387848 [Bipolaris maydis]KAJ6192250.1 hypothetical protein J3E72DRAFT_364618 [Bipolaris maydis]
MTETWEVEALGPGHPTYSDVSVSEILLFLTRRPLQPQFPLLRPHCRVCGSATLDRHITRPSNPNGNASRPYYICMLCKSNNEEGWVTWDDERGVCNSNPTCYCGVPSRQDREGIARGRPGLGFWTCATGSCDYYSRWSNGWTIYTPQCVEFDPWLL